MGRKTKIKVTEGPCPFCEGKEIFDGICFYCGKIVPLQNRGKPKKIKDK